MSRPDLYLRSRDPPPGFPSRGLTLVFPGCSFVTLLWFKSALLFARLLCGCTTLGLMVRSWFYHARPNRKRDLYLRTMFNAVESTGTLSVFSDPGTPFLLFLFFLFNPSRESVFWRYCFTLLLLRSLHHVGRWAANFLVSPGDKVQFGDPRIARVGRWAH